jgi:CDP-4-dehydro-6-deoxyglucose reductase
MTEELIHADIVSITPLTDSILQLILAPHDYIDYQAGQYLQIISQDEAFCYSIANAPLGSHTYELHLRHCRDNLKNQHLLAEMKKKGAVTIRLPLGRCDVSHLHPEKPILFIAGGTGFAPIKAMIEQLLADGEPRPFELFWVARSQSDLYMDDKVLIWKKHVSHFQYHSLLSNTSHHTLASMILSRHALDLYQWQMVMSGPFDMVYDTRDQLLYHGAEPKYLFSDAFEGEA